MNHIVERKIGVKGHFKLEAVNMETGARRFLAEFDNLITNGGMDRLANNSDWNSWCSVGSGNTAPAFTDSGLVTFIASTNNTSSTSNGNSGSSPWFGQAIKTFRFAIGTATGNLSEIGIGWSSVNGSLFSRALILDGSGNPTTITILSTEALDATYTLQLYAPTADVTGTVVVSGVSYAYTLRAASVSSTGWGGGFVFGDQFGWNGGTVFNGTIGAVTSTPSGSSATLGSPAKQSYTPGSFQIDTIWTMGLTDANVSGGISAAYLIGGQSRGAMGAFQVGFSPAIPKDGTKTLTLTFRQSWARH